MADEPPPQRSPKPARLDPQPDVARLEAEMRRSLPPGTSACPPAHQEARDATGSVQVVVDARGRVEDVTIDPQWRSRLTADEFPSALLDAYQMARRQATEAFAMARFAAREAGLDPPTLDDLAADRQKDPLLTPLGPTADRAARWRRIRDMRAQIAAQREQRKQREQVLADARRVREQTGPHGHLTATVRFGAVLSIAGDRRRLTYAYTEDLRQDALALLSQANGLP
jgi:hypothetical protein